MTRLKVSSSGSTRASRAAFGRVAVDALVESTALLKVLGSFVKFQLLFEKL